ncbi:MAG: 30S ribosomal protein S16 [Flavobacteriaceae bacterium]|nr:30S ribosomal protein S16 [Flavobacteriaceae bacterium]
MAVKLRLQRHGKKGKPFYWIVAADSRSKRDGRFLEKIGTYNPNLNPAEIKLQQNDAIKWLENGAQPTNTVRSILSYQGVLLRLHLKKGVGKGALTLEQAEEKFEFWNKEKQDKIQRNKERLTKVKQEQTEAIIQKEKSALKEKLDSQEAEVEAKNEEDRSKDSDQTKEEKKVSSKNLESNPSKDE